MGHAYALRQTESRLDQYANRILLETVASTSESRAMLETMNSSPYALCSDAEIEYFRQLIFQSQFLKAAGRMRDGKIECSTTSGRIRLQPTQYSPVMARQDGTRIYKRPAAVPGRRPECGGCATRGCIYCLRSLQLRFAGRSTHALHCHGDRCSDTQDGADDRRHSECAGEYTDARWQGEVGNTLYATRCSKDVGPA